MKFTRFTQCSSTYTGVVLENTIREIKGDIFGDWQYTGKVFPVAEVKLLAPLAPNQMIGIGANYVAKLEDRPAELPEIPVSSLNQRHPSLDQTKKLLFLKGLSRLNLNLN